MRDFVSGRPAEPPPDPASAWRDSTPLPPQGPGGAATIPKAAAELDPVRAHQARVLAIEEERRAKAAGLDMAKFYKLERAWQAACAEVRDVGENLRVNRAERQGIEARQADVRRAHREWGDDPAGLLVPELGVRIRALEEENERLRVEHEAASARAASLGELTGRLRDYLKGEGVLE
jgi:hypothetical protein